MGSTRICRRCLDLRAIAAGAIAALAGALSIGGCAEPVRAVPAGQAAPTLASPAAMPGGTGTDPAAVLDRLTWGASRSDFERIRALGTQRWIESQLQPDVGDGSLPGPVAEQIRALTISQTALPDLVFALDEQRKSADGMTDATARQAAQHDYQLEMNRLAREAAIREMLRDLYSPKQLQEQMTWFWFNHFNVHQHKHAIRAMVGDYEEQLRARALGRFRDLLGASAHHPAMLAYLDNAQNARDHINENYARELLELHTLGVDGGYTQRDVQELARVLTGFGIARRDPARAAAPGPVRAGSREVVRVGLFEFNPARHDYGDKVVLGHTIHGRGLAEFDEVLDLLARHPATARNVSRKLARFLVDDSPSPELVETMAQEFLRTDGDVPAVLRVAIRSREFAASFHGRFKDPVHYVVSAIRLAYDNKPILNANPMVNWLNRLGEAPFNHSAPDGYPLTEASWDGPGQMAIRFEIAKAIGTGSAGLFKTEGPHPSETPAFPQLANALFYENTQQHLAAATLHALDQAGSPQEWNLLLLSSPEFMLR